MDKKTQFQEWQKELYALNNQIKEAYRDKKLRNDLAQNRRKLSQKAIKLVGESEIASWMKNPFSAETIYFAEFLGYFAADAELSTSQIRNSFGEVKRIQMNAMAYQNESMYLNSTDMMSFRMLVPKLSYAAARSKKEGTDKFKEVMAICIGAVIEEIELQKSKSKEEDKSPETNDNINKINPFENFTNFFEAILAYHKTAGGD